MIRVLAWPKTCPNPYFSIIYDGLEREGVEAVGFSYPRAFFGRYDVLHIHFPDGVVYSPSVLWAAAKAVAFALCLMAVRLRRGRTVWTVHNLHSHEGHHPRLERLVFGLISRHADGVISLSQAALDAARQRFPALRQTPATVILHPHYRGVYPMGLDRTKARRSLKVPEDATVIGLIGAVRPYKNIPGLIKAFAQLPGDDLCLLIGGKPHRPSYGREVAEAAAGDARIRLHLRHLDDEELAACFKASDVIVLPYLDLLNSGAALAALSFSRPVAVARAGSTEELRDEVGGRWVRLTSGTLSADELAGVVAWARNPAHAQEGAPDLETFAPDTVRRQHAAFLTRLVARQGHEDSSQVRNSPRRDTP